MAARGGQPGNQNAANGKIWGTAIRQALERRTKSRADGKAEIDALADKLIDCALNGELPALKEFGDRLDGKSIQPMDIKGELNQKVSYTVKGIGKPGV